MWTSVYTSPHCNVPNSVLQLFQYTFTPMVTSYIIMDFHTIYMLITPQFLSSAHPSPYPQLYTPAYLPSPLVPHLKGIQTQVSITELKTFAPKHISPLPSTPQIMASWFFQLLRLKPWGPLCLLSLFHAPLPPTPSWKSCQFFFQNIHRKYLCI